MQADIRRVGTHLHEARGAFKRMGVGVLILEASRVGDDARKQARCGVAGKLGSQVVCEIENHVGA